MTEQNYEALGRYTQAKDDLSAALRQRNSALSDLKRVIDRVINTQQGWDAPVKFDAAAAKVLLDAAEQADTQARIALGQANAEAQQAGKPVLSWR